MHNKIRLITILLIPLFSACSTQATKPIQNTQSTDSKITVSPITINNSLAMDELTTEKEGKKLNLVRVMEGGACKNNLQGVTGLFKLYANTDEIEIVKKQKGKEAFLDFELLIQDFSMQALQQSINKLDFLETTDDLNNLQQDLSHKLSALFINFISDEITNFEKTTTLTIDVKPSKNTFSFFLDGCDIPHEH